jgi:hypothetical protein
VGVYANIIVCYSVNHLYHFRFRLFKLFLKKCNAIARSVVENASALSIFSCLLKCMLDCLPASHSPAILIEGISILTDYGILISYPLPIRERSSLIAFMRDQNSAHLSTSARVDQVMRGRSSFSTCQKQGP